MHFIVMLCRGAIIKINMRKIKTAKQMERHLKGLANHRRIEILFLVADSPGIILEGIIEKIGVHPSTVGEHVRVLNHAGLIDKRYVGRSVAHTLSPYGKIFVRFLKSFQKI